MLYENVLRKIWTWNDVKEWHWLKIKKINKSHERSLSGAPVCSFRVRTRAGRNKTLILNLHLVSRWLCNWNVNNTARLSTLITTLWAEHVFRTFYVINYVDSSTYFHSNNFKRPQKSSTQSIIRKVHFLTSCTVARQTLNFKTSIKFNQATP